MVFFYLVFPCPLERLKNRSIWNLSPKLSAKVASLNPVCQSRVDMKNLAQKQGPLNGEEKKYNYYKHPKPNSYIPYCDRMIQPLSFTIPWFSARFQGTVHQLRTNEVYCVQVCCLAQTSLPWHISCTRGLWGGLYKSWLFTHYGINRRAANTL